MKRQSDELMTHQGPHQGATLEIVYQPIVNHDDRTIFAFEALSRPQVNGIPISPPDWFADAMKSGKSVDADLCAIRRAIHHFAPLLPLPSTPYLFVNAMPTSLMHPRFLDSLQSIIGEVGFDAGRLVVEVIEAATYDVPTLTQVIARLRAIGIRIALDDVGIGSSGLRFMVDLEPDFIKLDMSLTQGAARSDARLRLFRMICNYMRSSHSIIAEGVEDADDLLAITSTGIGLSQGYFWSRPVSAKDACNVDVTVRAKGLPVGL